MKIGRKLIILTLLLIMTFFFSFYGLKNFKFENYENIIYRLQCHIFRDNSITVTTENLDINRIEIKSIEDNNIVFKEGKESSKITNEYGGDNFEIYYNNEFIGQAGILKTNWWHTHNYYFNILKSDSKIIFHFRVVGPNQNSLYYKYTELDSLKNKSTEVFYDYKGKTGQINIEYHDKTGKVVAEEILIDSLLTTLNIYSNGKFLRNYGIQKKTGNTIYKLSRLSQSDSLVYIYQTITNQTTKNERIAIKN